MNVSFAAKLQKKYEMHGVYKGKSIVIECDGRSVTCLCAYTHTE